VAESQSLGNSGAETARSSSSLFLLGSIVLGALIDVGFRLGAPIAPR
jgi:hypothetical protein